LARDQSRTLALLDLFQQKPHLTFLIGLQGARERQEMVIE
jgi:hypothetical protein